MPNRPFINFNNTDVYVVSLIYDQGKQVSGDYGDKMMYAISHNGEEFVTSQNPGGTLDVAFGAGKKGDVFTICKIRNDKGSYVFQVQKGDTSGNQAKPSDQLKPTEENKDQVGRETIPNTPTNNAPDWDLKEQKTQHEIRKAVCLKLAVEKIPEGAWTKKIETEIKGKYTTLMLLISDDLEIALAKLKTAENVFHLGAMWKKYSKLWGNILSIEDYTTAVNFCKDLKSNFEEIEKAKEPVKEPEEQPLSEEKLPF